MQEQLLTQPVEQTQASFDLVVEKLDSWLATTIAMLPNLVVAALIVVVFTLASKLVQRLTRKVLLRVTNPSIARLMGTIACMLVIAAGLFFALGVLELEKTVTSLLAGAGLIGLALALAFQDLTGNLIAGFYMSFKKPFVPGDLVETNDTLGTVELTDLRSTVLRTPEGQLVMIPNRQVFDSRLVNFTCGGSRRVDVPVGVSYGDDLEQVAEIAVEAVSAVEERDPERDVELYYAGFGSSSIDLTVSFWISSRTANYRGARSEAIVRLKKAFDEHGVTIPFPIRTLDFGIKGGEHVSEALSPLATAAGSPDESTRQQLNTLQ
jgi:small conductance mechanosensitive channel